MANIFIDVPNSNHTGYHSPALLKQVADDYQKYVVGAGRTVPEPLWYGTAMQESTLGKNSRNVYMAHPTWDDAYMKKVTNDFSKRNKGAWAKPVVNTGFFDQTKSDVDFYNKTTPNNQNGLKSISVTDLIQTKLANAKIESMHKDWDSRGWKIDKDYAANKLQEGLDKFGGDAGKAAIHYNPGRGTQQLAVPRYGQAILANPDVRQLIRKGM
jgi:hypothetical protein